MSGLIDAHVHLGGGTYAPAAEWEAAAARHGVGAAVLVQSLGNDDNAELLEAGADRDRFAVVGIPRGRAAAEELIERGAIGFRVSPRGLHAAPGEVVFDVLDAAGGLASVTGPFDELADDAFAALVDRHPRVHFRLEHVAAFPYADHADSVRSFAPVLRLASRPNVSLMWSGFFHYSRLGHPYRDAWPVLEAGLAAFGADRIHWSGDWNRAGGTDATYDADIALLSQLPFVDDAAREAIGHRTARRIFWEERP